MKRYSAVAVANEFLALAEYSHDITPMKLMKLVYFAHAWSWGFYGRPLIDEEFQAWRYGPVSPSLYQAMKEYGDTPIMSPLKVVMAWDFQQIIVEPHVDRDDTEAKDIIRLVWQEYGKYSAARLSQITHGSGTPWWQVSNRYGGNIPPWVTIPEESISEYYGDMVKASEGK